MKTLFSPVGTADPLTQLGDGPMLHIVRHYAPERVVLFLSPEMQKYRQEDMQSAGAVDVRECGRYEASIRRLCAAEGRSLPSIEYVNSPYNDVFRFDHYIEEFEDILERLCAESPREPVLVNATSGTPAFQESLVALGSFGRLPLKILQVVTPKGKSNSRDDREKASTYDLDTLWEWNESLRESDPKARASRIFEVKTPNFADRLLRENVISMVKGYDYEAACGIASGARHIDLKAKQMIEAARDRLNLEGALPAKAFAGTAYAYRPNDLLGEYLSVMEVRLAQGHWADFVRLLTPALTQLCKKTLQENGLPERAYLKFDKDGKPTDKLDWALIEKDARLAQTLGASRSNRATYISNGMLASMVETYCEDESAKKKLTALRNVEDKCRNRLAHTVASSNREQLERLGGLKLSVVLQYLFDLHGGVRKHLYADINDAIIEHL